MTAIILVATLVAGGLSGLAVRRWLATPARVTSSSMEPTLRPGQRIVVWRPRPAAGVNRGDLVVVRSEELGRDVVKRAIGLPGERIDLDHRGRVCVEGRPLAEPYAVPATRAATGTAGTYTVPEASLFLLGDNRAASSDSRAWRQPFLPRDAVVGRVLHLRTGRQP